MIGKVKRNQKYGQMLSIHFSNDNQDFRLNDDICGLKVKSILKGIYKI